MKLSKLSRRRNGTTSSNTVAKPDSNAPKTKNGGNSVECHPKVAMPAKSNPTMLCTDMTSGAMIAARSHGNRELWI
ncbi:MAG: hypothetical protein ACREC0_02105 [Methylocella sp.]